MLILRTLLFDPRHGRSIAATIEQTSGDVLGPAVSWRMGMTLIGVAAGPVGAFGVTRAISGLLYAVSAADPLSLHCRVAALLGPLFTSLLQERDFHSRRNVVASHPHSRQIHSRQLFEDQA